MLMIARQAQVDEGTMVYDTEDQMLRDLQTMSLSHDLSFVFICRYYV